MTTLAALLVPYSGTDAAGARTLVAAALGLGGDDRPGRAPEGLTVRVDRVQPRAGHLSVGLDVAYSTDLGPRRDYLVASDAPVAIAAAHAGRAALLRPAPEAGDEDDDRRAGSRPGGVAVAEDETGTRSDSVAVWRHPADPELPGLAAACTLAAVRAALPDAAGLEVVTYRPLRRAVVRVTAADGSALAYLKVVAPRRLAGLRARHELVEEAPGAVECLGPGVLALTALPGVPLTDRLVAGAPVPPLARLRPRPAGSARSVEPAADMTPTPPGPPAVQAWADTLPTQVDAARGVLTPATHARLAVLAARAGSSWRRHRDAVGATGLVHGDLHPGNVLLTESGDVAGHLDLDRAGTGLLVDDDACLLAHTEILALDHPGAGEALAGWWSQVPTDDPGVLAATRARVAAVLLTLVPVLAHRASDVLDLAERLLGPVPPPPVGPSQKEEER
ncbi:phosphotransferase family enzyme [Salana multivorans]|uniref:Phosphotransferase family enzyme n=1 Tax=Salana multivorans TaxID=120377 RepID=A0A3N2DBZ0_9MICO|nr:phosphotransferase [Salana multivorans]ROR97319.1 phosphotransferase family enzyme [Salana multivorans]